MIWDPMNSAKDRTLVCITGIPGSGKTIFARRIGACLGARVLSVTEIAKSSGAFEGSDPDGTLVVDMHALRRAVVRALDGLHGTIIVEGHLAHEFGIDFDAVVVVRVRLAVLERRLASRGYGPEKRANNIIAEALDYCGESARSLYSNVAEVTTEAEKLALLRAVRARGWHGLPKPSGRSQKNGLGELLKFIRSHPELGL